MKSTGPEARQTNNTQKAQSAKKVNQAVNATKVPRPVHKVIQGCAKTPASAKRSLNTKVICDIANLVLVDQTSKKFLRCELHDKAPISDKVPPRIARLLKSHDLVMELVSDYEAMTGTKSFVSDKKFVVLAINRNLKGNCPNHDHPAVVVSAASSTDDKYSRDWKTQQVDLLKIPARPIPATDRLSAWILPFWRFLTGVMDLNVGARSCGVGVQSPVNHEFTALVRIFPNDQYELTFQLPPFKKWAKEKERRHWDDKKMDAGSTSASTFGKKTSGASYEREKVGDKAATWSSTVGQQSGDRYNERKSSYKDGQLTAKSSQTSYSAGGLASTTVDSDGETSHHTSLKLELKHNGEPYKLEETLENTVNIVFTIVGAIVRIKDMLDLVPKVGLTYKFEVSVLEGSIKGTWGNRIPEGADSQGPRYTAVQPFFDIDVELKLFDLSFELGFGFELRIPPVIEWFDASDTLEIILKAAIEASIDVGIKYTAKSTSKENHKLAIESKPKLKVFVEFAVNVFGKGLRSIGGVRGGFECEASFHVSFSHAPDFEAKAGSKPIELYGEYFYDVVLWDSSGHWERVLVEEHNFYEGTLPPTAHGGAGGSW